MTCCEQSISACSHSCSCSCSAGTKTAISDKVFRIFGYTEKQLQTNNSSESVLGVTRPAIRAVEYVAHLVAAGADMVVVQRMPDGTPDEG